MAIIDLDYQATQPMHSSCGRYVIVFNGEIYNFRDLHSTLVARGTVFRTTSDTEVLLELFAAEGEAMLPKLHGMFSFVIWDRLARRAFAARDPYGIKPLYLGKVEDGVILASQVKALLATGLISRDPDLYGQAGFWMLGSVPEPRTWYRDVVAVKAGHCLWIEDGRVAKQYCWHDVGASWTKGVLESSAQPPVTDIQKHVRVALRESVERHLVADVPVGVFLSGGIDSGALAGLMVEAGARELQGVTIAYDEFSGHHEDEIPGAAQIAKYYNISHHVRRVGREEFLHDLPSILGAMDQPSIDGVNTWYASKAVAELGLKVVVSGVGGDELFLGYESFRQLPRMVMAWGGLSVIPGAMQLAQIMANWQAERTGNTRWAHAPEWALNIEGAWWLRRSVNGPEALSVRFADVTKDFRAADWVRGMTGRLSDNSIMALAQIESLTYLRNQLLRDSDWSSMAHGVELRTPLVDAILLDKLKCVLPFFSAFPNKTLLANAPSLKLPDSIIHRRKTGFGIPVQRWLHEAGLTEGDAKTWAGWMRTVVQAYE